MLGRRNGRSLLIRVPPSSKADHTQPRAKSGADSLPEAHRSCRQVVTRTATLFGAVQLLVYHRAGREGEGRGGVEGMAPRVAIAVVDAESFVPVDLAVRAVSVRAREGGGVDHRRAALGSGVGRIDHRARLGEGRSGEANEGGCGRGGGLDSCGRGGLRTRGGLVEELKRGRD